LGALGNQDVYLEKIRVFIPDAQGNPILEVDPEVSEEFKAMNIIVQMPHIHFV